MSIIPVETPSRRWRPRLPGLRIDVVAALALLVVVVMVLTACFADILAPYKFIAIDLRARKVPPFLFGGSVQHLLGTDELGRDILSRLFFGLRTSILLAVCAAAISLMLGTVLGLIAGFRGGLAAAIIRVAIDFQASTPFVIVALAVLAFFGNSILLFMLVLGLYGWERYARLISTLTRAELERGYVAALRRNGASNTRIALKHVLPNVMPIAVVTLTLVLPEVVLLESSLSFLGLGIQPPLVSLGNMVGYGRDYIMTDWWISIIPGIAIFVFSLAFSALGDWLRDLTDPTLR